MERLFGPALHVRESEPAPARPPQGSGVIPPARTSEATITTESALGLDAVYRAVQILATAVAQLSIDVERHGGQIESPTWMREPDVAATPEAFWTETVTSLALSGNAFWRVHRHHASGQVTNLRLLPPFEVGVTLDPATGRRTYSHGGRDLKTNEVRHLQLLRVPGAARGLGPIQAARATLAGAIDLRDYAAEWFHDGQVPTGVLTSEASLSADQAATMKERWAESQGGRRGIAVLGHGLTYAPVLIAPKDAQFLESQQFTVTSIARLFGIPSHLMLAAVEGTSQTYVNVAQADLTFVRWTLSAYTREIETTLTTLLPRGQRARFNLNALLRPDTKARYEAHAIAIASGFLSVDEVRGIENLPALNPTPQEVEAP